MISQEELLQVWRGSWCWWGVDRQKGGRRSHLSDTVRLEYLNTVECAYCILSMYVEEEITLERYRGLKIHIHVCNV